VCMPVLKPFLPQTHTVPGFRFQVRIRHSYCARVPGWCPRRLAVAVAPPLRHIYLSIYVSIQEYMHVHLSLHPSVHLSIHLCLSRTRVVPRTAGSGRGATPSTYLSMYPYRTICMYPSICPSIYTSMHSYCARVPGWCPRRLAVAVAPPLRRAPRRQCHTPTQQQGWGNY